jgi:hypothetical protein
MPANQITGGGFQDSSGNVLANGRLKFELKGLQGFGVIPGTVEGTVTGICEDTAVEIPLNEDGNAVNGFLIPNDIILQATLSSIAAGFPTGTTPSFYLMSAYSADGELAWGPNAVFIPSSPSPFNLGALVPGNPS